MIAKETIRKPVCPVVNWLAVSEADNLIRYSGSSVASQIRTVRS
jgi:hypothetical protein